ncbi:MAG: aldo/keto reductase [candidate division Zixibacteria bacterium]|nr:aldo/keto reductase [candidate division Zixibacteria bacterium]
MGNSNSEVSRRRFLTASATGLVAAGLANLTPGATFAQITEKETAGSTDNIIYRTLGRTGMKVPVVSMGAGACNDPSVLQAAYEVGMRHYDTAANYQFGANEQLVGSVLHRMGVRDKCIIGSKIYTPQQRRNLTTEQAKKKLMSLTEGTLKRLKSDYVDILYIHMVDNRDTVADDAIREAMARIKADGKARALGISTHTNMADVIDEVAKDDFWDVVLTSINFTMADDTALLTAINKAADRGVGFVGMKTMAGGGRWPNPDTRQSYDQPTITAALLKWVLNNKNIHTIIPGFNNHQHLREDFAVATNLTLTDMEKRFLSDNNVKLGMGFCRQCRKCLASCPNDADVPTLMRTHMYAAQYADFYLARQALAEISGHKGITACVSCDACAVVCANAVNVRERINELKLMYA